MADYKSGYTGQQIDEAVGRALIGGPIDIEQEALSEASEKTQSAVFATSLSSKTVTLDVSELQAFLDALPRLLTESFIINVSGTLEAALHIYSFYGGGGLAIRAAERGGCVFRKSVLVSGKAAVSFTNCAFSNPDAATHNDHELSVSGGAAVRATDCDFTGNGLGTAVEVSTAPSSAVLYGCTVKDYRAAAIAIYGGTVIIVSSQAADTSGNVCGAWVWHCGMVQMGSDTDPLLGGTYHTKQGGIIAKPDGTLA